MCQDLASDSLDKEYYCYSCMIWLNDLMTVMLNDELFVVTLCHLCAPFTDDNVLAKTA
jgi:hypothetical protein